MGDPVTMLREGAVYIIALVLSICVHEFGHAYVADRLGDPLPRSQGRVTLNPIAHIDPFGTLLMPLLALFSGPAIGSRILGWGKPVHVSAPRRFGPHKNISLKTFHLLTSLAGPAMNILFALVLTIVLVAMLKFGSDNIARLTDAVVSVIGMNIGLAFFNLIPCPPLDGGAILRGILPRELEWICDWLDRFGFMILFALLLTGALSYFMIPARYLTQLWLRTVVHLMGA